jgi:hypothetical protein
VTNPLLQDALEYHHRGWCILPIRAGTKRPACKNWKQFQTKQTTESQLKSWFKNGSRYGLSVVLGEVSDGLVCRDFDDMTAYQQWATNHPELARTLPTVETGRPGMHVYCLGASQQISSHSPSNGTIIDLGDGELRSKLRWVITTQKVKRPRLDGSLRFDFSQKNVDELISYFESKQLVKT